MGNSKMISEMPTTNEIIKENLQNIPISREQRDVPKVEV